MDVVFNQAVNNTLVIEGVLSDNPNDAGGLTKFGITHASWSAYASGKTNLPQSVKDITRDQAIAFYRSEYWDKPGFYQLPNEIAPAVFDFAVNSGTAQAVRVLQSVLHVPVDGKLGPQTLAALAAVNTASPVPLRKLRNSYVIARGVFLMNVVQGNPKDVTFLEGWFKRVIGQLDFAY